MQVTSRSRWQIRLQNIIFFVLLTCVISALAWLSTQYYYQADWTAGKRNTLAADTRLFLQGLDEAVTITAYVPNEPELRQRISENIERYSRYKQDISLEFVDPNLEPGRAERAGVTRNGQLSISIGERSETVDDITEQTITNSLQRLSRKSERWLVFLEGHGERDPDDNSNPGLSRLQDSLVRSGFKVQKLNLIRTPVIPDNTSVLVIAGVQGSLTPGELQKIQDFVAQGGALLWLHDPAVEDSLARSDLDPLSDDLALRFISGTLVDANPEIRQVLGIKHPAVVPVVDYEEHPVTRGLKFHTLFPFAGGIDVLVNEESLWRPQPILLTLPRAWSETGGFMGEDISFSTDAGDTAGPLMLGLSLTRQREDRQQRVIVVGDSDFVANAYIGQGSNLELGLNLFNWLSQDEGLLSISPRAAPDTQLQLSKPRMIAIVAGFLLVLPLGLLIVGFTLWFKRRNQ